jgi:hypothetical protein
MDRQRLDVRFVPKADSCTAAKGLSGLNLTLVYPGNTDGHRQSTTAITIVMTKIAYQTGSGDHFHLDFPPGTPKRFSQPPGPPVGEFPAVRAAANQRSMSSLI